MKKTLFAVAALALCGTAFAGEYNTKDFTDHADFNKFNEAVTLNVNATVAFHDFNLAPAKPLVLNFFDSHTFSVTGMFNVNAFGVTSITGDGKAATYWENELLNTVGTPATITLVSSSAGMSMLNLQNVTFMGKSENQTLTLGNTELTYVGYTSVHGSTDMMDQVKNSLLDGQIALVGVSDVESGAGLYLVGKVGSSVPEPATAALSLLALAGLAARRRRK